MSQEPQVQYVRSADGANIAFFQMGDGVPLILSPNIWHHLIAGWQWEDREAVLRLVRDGFHVVCYDMRGMGMSDRDATDFSVEAQVADLEALRQHLGFEQFALFGFVHASPACITYAARYPERLTHLILVIAFANGEVWYQTVPTLRGLESFRAMGDEQWELYTLMHATALTAVVVVGEADPRRFAAILRQCTTPETLRRYFAALRTQDVTPLLAEVRTPTLVITRTHGLGTEHGQTVVQAISQARLAIVEPGLSMPSLQDAALVTQFVLGRDSSPVPDPEVAPADRGTSGTVVILFADIAGSTALTERMGDAAFRAKARELDDALRAIIRAAGGSAIDGKLLGDGVLATFPAAAQAIEAALTCARAGDDGGLPLHLGLHAGDVIREDDNIYGGAVNIASRISMLAAPGEVLVSDIVRGLARTSTGATFEDRSEQDLKGVGDPVRVWAVRSGDR